MVDASGFRSPLAEKLGLREEPTRLRHHSRSIFTHMIDVKPYEDDACRAAPTARRTRGAQGTLHHIFDGGWLWVIPFNNHPRATNPLCQRRPELDPRVHPQAGDVTPEEEFREFIARFPAWSAQFEPARAVREWVSTGRLQYSLARRPSATAGA